MDNLKVNTVVAETLDTDSRSLLGIHDFTTVFVFTLEGFQGLYNYLAGLVNVCSVFNSNFKGKELIGVVLSKVLEVLGKEGAVGEGDYRTVRGHNLGTLVAHGIYGSADTVAFDYVSDPQAPGHQLDAVEEVVEHILHCEAHTGCKTCGNNCNCRGWNLKHHERDDYEKTPAEERNKVVG